MQDEARRVKDDGAVTWSAQGLRPSVHSAWSPQTLAPVAGPIVHIALRCTWVGGACTWVGGVVRTVEHAIRLFPHWGIIICSKMRIPRMQYSRETHHA